VPPGQGGTPPGQARNADSPPPISASRPGTITPAAAPGGSAYAPGHGNAPPGQAKPKGDKKDDKHDKKKKDGEH